MKKIIILSIFMLLFLFPFVHAADFVPNGNISGRGIYSMYNMTQITTNTLFCFQRSSGRVCFNETNFTSGTYSAGLGLNLTGTTFNINESYMQQWNESSQITILFTQLNNVNNTVIENNNSANAQIQILFTQLNNVNNTQIANNNTQSAQINTKLTATATTCGTGNVSKFNGTGFQCVDDTNTQNTYLPGLGLNLTGFTFNLNLTYLFGLFYQKSEVDTTTSLLQTNITNVDSRVTSVNSSLQTEITTQANNNATQATLIASRVVIGSDANILLNWSYIQNFPVACPSGSYVTQVGSTITCTSPTGDSYILISGYGFTFNETKMNLTIDARASVFNETSQINAVNSSLQSQIARQAADNTTLTATKAGIGNCAAGTFQNGSTATGPLCGTPAGGSGGSNFTGVINTTQLNSTNSPSIGQVASYNGTADQFTWITPSTGSGSGNTSSTGTAGYIPQFQSGTILNNSIIYQNNSRVYIYQNNSQNNKWVSIYNDGTNAWIGTDYNVGRVKINYLEVPSGLYVTGGANPFQMTGNSYATMSTGLIGAGNHLVTGGTSADFGYRTTANHLFSIGATEVMRINANGSVGIGGDSSPVESNAKLTICCGTTASPFNATYFRNTGVNYGSEVRSLYSPSNYNTAAPSYFRWYMQGASGDSAFGVVVHNTTASPRQLLTVDGAYNTVAVGDDSLTVDNAAFKVQNTYSKSYPVLVTSAADGILFRVNDTGAIALATTATLGIGTGTTANQNEVKLQVQGGTSGTPFNATLLYNPGVNHGSEVKLLMAGSSYNINRPSYIRTYMNGAGGESLMGFIVTNATAETQLLTLDGLNKLSGFGDTSPDAYLKIQNNQNYINAFRVTNSADSVLFNVNHNGSVTVTQNLTVNNNISMSTAGSCLFLPGGGKLCGNTTCTSMYSPNGLSINEVCN